jgi:Zn-dependent M28 family amino/carboxypeptidase
MRIDVRLRLALGITALAAAPALGQISPEERTVLDALDTTRVVTTLRHLSEDVAVEPTGAGLGTAVAGSPAEKVLADTIEGEMQALGFDVVRERFPVRRYDYGKVRLEADGEALPAITLHSSRGTWGSRDGVDYRLGTSADGKTLRAQLVDAGEGFASDYERIGKVEGRVVLVRRTVWPSATELEASVRGASAVLFYDYPGDNPDDALKQDGIQYHDEIPALAITKRDAKHLVERLAQGQVEITLENRVDVGYGFSENVIGRMTGTEEPDEIVSVTAHHDRWHQGAQDNAVGVATMLEIGRVMKQASPRRTLLLISFGSEEAGGIATPYDWLTGSYAFVKAHPEIASRLVYGFNIDGAGWSAEKGHLFATPENLPFQRTLLADLDLGARIQLHEGVTNWVDAWSLGAIGGGSASYLLWFRGHPFYENPGSFSRYYHTQLDVYRPRDYQNLDIDLDLGTLGVLRADRAPIVPVTLSAVGEWVQRVLTEDGKKAPSVSFKDAMTAADRFQREAQKVEVEAATGSVSRADRERWNRTLMNVRHELLPWLLSDSSSGARLKTTPYVSDLEALSRAREALSFRDVAKAADALVGVATMDSVENFSEESYFLERVHSFGPASWGTDFEQDARPVSPEIFHLYTRLRRDGGDAGDVTALEGFEAQARGNLEEALLLIAGKLRQATRSLGALTSR